MNVTKEIQNKHILYGASDYTAPHSLVGSRSLNYAEGPTITRPALQECSVIPFTFNYQDTVGLFGVENYFTKIKLDIIGDVLFACFEEEGWECANVSNVLDTDPFYGGENQAIIDDSAGSCIEGLNTYACARTSGNSLPDFKDDAYVSIDLINNKTGNRFTDDWLDVRLYTREREEHPYERMWVKVKDFFYVGFHARNTKRLPFDVQCVIGLKFANYDGIPDKREIMRR